MIYDDYQIFNEDTYQIMMKHYELQNQPTLDVLLNQIYFNLNKCLSMCFCTDISANKSILNAISNTSKTIQNILENIKQISTINQQDTNQFSNFNIFKLLKKLSSLIVPFNQYILQQKKEYPKQVMIQNLNQLQNILQDLLQTLSECGIKFYKYM